MTEFNSGVVIAGIGEAPQDNTVLDNHTEEDFSGDIQFHEREERGGSQPSAISLPTTGVSVVHGVHGDMKHNTAGIQS